MTVLRRRREKVLLLAAAAALPPLVGSTSAFAAPPSFAPGVLTGNIQNSGVTEASGIAASRFNPNILWTHDDSGSGPTVYPMTPAGTNLGTYTITGAGAIDWEDIAVGPGPAANTQYLYIADVGDNAALRSSVSVYRVAEPAVSDTQPAMNIAVGGMSKLTFAYPNGPRDAESVFVDPLSKDLYIVSKRESTKFVYRAAYPQATSGTTTMQLVASLPNATWITAADISPDGDEIILRGVETNSALLYTRPIGGSIADAFATTPVSIPLVSEAQGEAIGFDPQGWGYFTTTEGGTAPISYFNRLPPPGAAMYWDNDAVVAGSRTSTGAGTGGTGTWDTSSKKWYTGAADVAWVDGNDAVFWGTAGTVTLSAAKSVNSLSFKTTGYLVGGSTLTLGGSSITVDSGVSATINSVVAGSVGLVKNGAGTLKLGAANTYSGGTVINAGVLGIVSSSLGAQPVSPGTNVTINNGATLRFDVNNLTLSPNRSVLLGPGGGVIDVQSFNNMIAGVVSGSSLTKNGAGTLTLQNANTYTGATTVNAGTLVMSQGLKSGAALSIASGADAVVPVATPSSYGAGQFPSGNNATASRISSLTITGTGQLDLGNSDMAIDYTGMSPLDTVRNLLATGGITSAAALSIDPDVFALGYAENADLPSPYGTGANSFFGTDVDGTSVLMKFTWLGDLDLDGFVDFSDLSVFNTNYDNGASGGRYWSEGDFNYDGFIDFQDLSLFNTNYDPNKPSLPEPTGAAILSVAAIVFARRRRCSVV